VNSAPTEDRCGLPKVGDHPVRAVPDVDLVDDDRAGIRHPHDVPRKVRERDERLELRQLDVETLPERRARIRPFGRPGRRSGAAVEIGGCRLVGREDPCLRARLDGHVRDREALVHRERLRARADELEHRVRAAADADLSDHGEDHVLPRHELPGPAGQLDLDRLGHCLPERPERQARRDVRRPEPRPEGAEGAVGAGV
jgi:hypothetical protein